MMGDIFDLATDDLANIEEMARLNPLDPAAAPEGGLSGFGQQLKGALRPSAGAGRTIMMAGAPVAIGVDKLADAADALEDFVGMANPWGARAGVPEREPNTAAQEAYFSLVDRFGSAAVDYWTPDARDYSAAEKTVGVLANVAGAVPQMIGTPGLFLANTGMDPATELVRQGVDANTALQVGGVNLTANAIGMRIPASFGNTLTQRVASGAGANLAVGVAADAGSAAALQRGGYTEQAAGYDVTDPYARGFDLLLGAAFGVKAQIDAPAGGAQPAPLAQRDAVLTAKNHDHLNRQTLPGEPLTPQAHRASTTAATEAIDALLRGERVDVAAKIDPAQYRLPAAAPAPAAAGGADFDTALAAVFRAEGGYVNDPVDRGGETKFGISRRAHPGVDIRNLTREQAAEIYRREYWDAIGADRLPPEMREVAFDAAVNQGVPWTQRALREAGGDRAKFIALRRARYAEIIAKDPKQARFRKGWENRLRRFETPAQPARQPFADPDALEAARVEAIGRQYDIPEEALRQIAQPAPRDGVTGFFDGRAGSVKADMVARAVAHVEQTGEAGHFVSVDISNLGGLNAAMGNRAEAANVHYNALANILVRELSGKDVDVVPMRTGGDEFGAVVLNARGEDVDAAIARAQRKVAEYVEREGLAEIPNPKRSGEYGVGLHIGRTEIVPGDAPRTVFDRADDGVNYSKQRAEDVARIEAGADGAVAPAGPPRGTGGGAAPAVRAEPGAQRGGGGSQRGEAEGAGGERQGAGLTHLDDAARIAAEQPDAQIAIGFDADGQPIYQPIADALASIEAERAQAVRDADAFGAAVSCFARRGAAA